jgi:O-antigen/teichoic acid export membrane protein
MILWASLGMLFRAASFAIAFVFLAKGASNLFFWNELIANVYILGLNIAGYYLLGLTGLGISFLIGYILYFTQELIVSEINYDFSFNKPFIRIFVIQLVLALSCFLSVKLMPTHVAYGVGSILIVISACYSWKELDKRMDIKLLFIKSKLKR